MTASRFDIENMFDAGVKLGATHLLVVCDTFDYEDYPVYVGVKDGNSWQYSEGTVDELIANFSKPSQMSRVHEVYNLSMDKDKQIDSVLAWNL